MSDEVDLLRSGQVLPAGISANARQNRGYFPHICIAVPTLNEAAYIEGCLLSLIAQWPQDSIEILVLDGGSTDRTAEIVESLSLQYPFLRLVHNPRRIQSAAVNLAADIATPRARILVRADAHCVYPAGFLQRCVSEMLRVGATSVVVPMRNEAQEGLAVQRAIAVAQSSRLGNGGAAHRTGAGSGFVDHGHHAVFDRDFFLSIGGYDESFTHNEDAEFDHRAIQAGGRVWMCREAPVVYFPRKSFSGLARQYFRHGRGRARTLLKHRLRPRARQMAPVVAFGLLLGGLLSAPFAGPMVLPVLAYPLLCLSWGARQAIAQRDPSLLLTGPVLITMHMSWASGFLTSVLREIGSPSRATGSVPSQPEGVAATSQQPSNGR